MPTVTVVVESSLPPDRILAAAHDFTDRRTKIFPAVQAKHFEVHELGENSADATEGTRSGPMYNWERCNYTWSESGPVQADVTGSNAYKPEGSWWELTAVPKGGGSEVTMTWERVFGYTPKGRLLNFVFTHFGDRLFGNYAKEVVENMEGLER